MWWWLNGTICYNGVCIVSMYRFFPLINHLSTGLSADSSVSTHAQNVPPGRTGQNPPYWPAALIKKHLFVNKSIWRGVCWGVWHNLLFRMEWRRGCVRGVELGETSLYCKRSWLVPWISMAFMLGYHIFDVTPSLANNTTSKVQKNTRANETLVFVFVWLKHQVNGSIVCCTFYKGPIAFEWYLAIIFKKKPSKSE